jgi:hypothetical protein
VDYCGFCQRPFEGSICVKRCRLCNTIAKLCVVVQYESRGGGRLEHFAVTTMHCSDLKNGFYKRLLSTMTGISAQLLNTQELLTGYRSSYHHTHPSDRTDQVGSTGVLTMYGPLQLGKLHGKLERFLTVLRKAVRCRTMHD